MPRLCATHGSCLDLFFFLPLLELFFPSDGGNINGGGPVEERDRGPSCCEQFCLLSARSGGTKQATVSTYFVIQPPCMEDVRMELVL